MGKVLEGGEPGSWDERGIGTRHVVHTDGGMRMIFEGVDGAGRHRLGLATSLDGGRSWTKQGMVFEGRTEADAWDSRNVGTPWLCKKPDGSGWRLYYVGTRTDAESGFTSYAIGCAESAGDELTRWTRVEPTC